MRRLRAWRYFFLRRLQRYFDISAIPTYCFDCGSDDDYYMLRDEVWAATGMGRRGHLCIACVEERLGRTLTREDFTDVDVNDLSQAWPRSARLIDRLRVGCRNCGGWVPRGYAVCVVCGRW
jgi:hypothetical protein